MAVEILDRAKILKELISKPDTHMDTFKVIIQFIYMVLADFCSKTAGLEHVDSLLENLLAVISPDVLAKRKSYKSQSTRCYAIKPEVDVLLDVGIFLLNSIILMTY